MTITKFSCKTLRKRTYTKTAKTGFAYKMASAQRNSGLHENGGDKLFRVIAGWNYSSSALKTCYNYTCILYVCSIAKVAIVHRAIIVCSANSGHRAGFQTS